MAISDNWLSAEEADKLLHATTDAIVVADDNGTIVLANPQAEALFGYGSRELIGQSIELLVPEAARDRHRAHRQRYGRMPHARPLLSGLSLKGRRKDGTHFDAEIALTPVEGNHRRLVASTIRRIEAGDTSEAYFRQLLESAPDAMVIVDDHGRIAIVNDQTEKMFGHTKDQLIGQHVEMLLPESARARHVGHRRKYAADPRVRPMGIDMELYGRRADGTEFPVEISLSPVTSASGSFVSSVIRDVTRRKQMETELIDARQQAERAHKANTAFLAAASHDLRQPVQALSLLNGALRRTVKEPHVAEMVDSQQHSLDAMTNLLNSLLDISRLDAGAVAPEIEDFPVQRLIDRLASECERQARHKGLACVAESDGSTIRSDPNLLGEIIQNFVSNAIRYTGKGQVTLACRDLGGRLSIDVRDTGIGIAAEQIDEIFREFHQLRTPGTDNEGFGLGLAIVRRLADLLGHEIVVDSAPGKGSCFSVIVPAVERRPVSASVPDDSGPRDEPAGGLILLVEDDRKVAGAWRMLLQAEGYRVLVAETAGEAATLAGALDEPPDLIISDFHLLDGSSGVDAVSRVRGLFERELPAFIVSGDTSKVVDEARKLDNSVLLSKPVNTDDLLAKARTTIAAGRVPET